MTPRPAPPSYARRAIDEVLADGDTHTRAELIAAAAAAVPLPVATRRAELDRRKRQRLRGFPETPRRVGDASQAAAAGAYALAADALRKGVGKATIIRCPDGTYRAATPADSPPPAAPPAAAPPRVPGMVTFLEGPRR